MSTDFAGKYHDVDYSHDIDDLGHERGLIDFKRVVAAARLVETSGVLEIVVAERALDRAGKGAGGRKALVSDRAILTILMLLALDHDALHLTLARYIVTNRLGEDSLRYLDLKMGKATNEQVYHRVARAFQRFVTPINPFQGNRRKRLTPAEFAIREAVRSEEANAKLISEKNSRLHVAVNRLVGSSVKKMPVEMSRAFKGDYAIDGTFVRANGKRGTDFFNGQYVATEYDGGRQFRLGNHGAADNPGQAKSKSKNFWGFELTTVTMIRESLSAPVSFSQLIVSLAWDIPGGQPGQNGIEAFAGVLALGLPLEHVVADRAYFAGAAVENFHEQMSIWGAKPVTDYKVTQLGNTEQCCGAIQVEGTWYCPSMPYGLVNASIDFRAGTIDLDTYLARIEGRRKWAAVRKSRPNKNGTTRWSHPTGLGQRCKGEDKFCTQKTMSQPREVGLKYAQEYAYMSAEWRARYPLRNSVESTNATLKRGATHNLGDPERRRIRGRTSQFILAALVVVAANIKLIRDFVWADKNRAKIERIKSNRKRVPFGYSSMNDDERQAIEERRQARE